MRRGMAPVVAGVALRVRDERIHAERTCTDGGCDAPLIAAYRRLPLGIGLDARVADRRDRDAYEDGRVEAARENALSYHPSPILRLEPSRLLALSLSLSLSSSTVLVRELRRERVRSVAPSRRRAPTTARFILRRCHHRTEKRAISHLTFSTCPIDKK